MNRLRPERLDARTYREFALKSMSRMGPLSESEANLVRQALNEIESWPQGQELVSEGVAADSPRLLLEGWALRQRGLSDGQRQIFGFVLPGDVYGLCGRPDGLSMCSMVAATPAASIPVPFLAKALRQDMGTLSRFAWAMVTEEEAGLRDQVVRLGRQSAHERLIHLLLEFYFRLKQVGLVNGTSFQLPLSQEVLSDALGLSVVHTNRTLQQLRREHLIETRSNHIILTDPKRMTEMAEYRLSPRLAALV